MAKTVAIVGGGCAGLGAAATLLNQAHFDVDVILIDPNDRLGGRARTSSVPGLPVDLGPQFIQDPEINPWATIMKNLGFEGQQPEIDTLYRRRLEDKSWETAAFNKDISAMNDQLAKQYRLESAYKNAPIMTIGSSELCKNQQDMRLSLGSNTLGAIGESAEPWQYLASDRARQTGGEHGANIYVIGGLGSLVSAYGEELKRNKRLTTRQATVVSIDDENSKKILIVTSDDDTLECDFCIVTIPVGEFEKVEFRPPLQGEKIRALSFIALGSYKKVAFRPSKFPFKDPDSIKPNNEYYIYDDKRDGVWQYFRLPTDDTILICVAAGDFASDLDSQPKEEVPFLIINLLQQSYPDGDFTPRPSQEDGPAIEVTNWTNTPHIGGAYSYTRHNNRFDADNPIPFEARDKIAKPQGRIHFAGEATWTDAYGTIHGAYFSGERAAKEILKDISD